jgi:dihydropteroate synthase
MGIVNMTPDYDEIIKMVQTLLTLEGTSAVVTAGIMNGARIVRVHDVKEIKMVVTITEKIRTAA